MPMDARLRNIFSRRRSQKHDQLGLKAHPYESTIKDTSPIKGTRPIAGNGPYRLENVALQSQELEAEPPNVPRSRRDSYSQRPQTAPQSASIGPYRRTRSGISTKAPSTSSRHTQEPSLTNPYYPPLTTQRLRSVRAFSSDALQSHSQSPHVDILDAVTRIKPSAQTFIQKKIASGERDYGEDVADRNIAEFGGYEFPQHDTYSYYTDDAAHSQEEPSQDDELQDRPYSREGLDWRDGSTTGHVSQFDTTPLNQHTQYNQIPSNSTQPTAANSHARRDSGNSDCNVNGRWAKGRTGKSSSASTEGRPSDTQAPWSNTITSANLCHLSGGLNHAMSTNEPIREAANSSQPIRRTKESRGTQTTPPPPEPIIIPPIVPLTTSNQQDTEASDSDGSCDPPPILRSRLSRCTVLPTPPMSPTTRGSPTTPIPRPSLEKELPTPLPGMQATSTSKRHSRGESANFSGFAYQDPGRNEKSIALSSPVKASKNSSSNKQPKESERDVPISEGPTESSRIEDVVDLRNTTNTEVITARPPAVVHEHVTSNAHHIKEEPVTRDIQNHDVFHRIQPITDVEVLSTKHYVPAPNGNGLIEIPESELTGRHTKWALRPVDDKLVTSASVPYRMDIKTTDQNPEYKSGGEPPLQGRQKSVTDDGIREETVWRHPPQLEDGGQDTGQTVPLNINHYGDEDTDNDYDTASELYAASDPYAGSEQSFSSNADGEEELLFRDSDLAFDGRLPGLEEVNPVVEGNVSSSRPSTATTVTRKPDEISNGEATKILRRRQEAELARKMGDLSVAGRQ